MKNDAETIIENLKKDLNDALEKGWKEFSTAKEYPIIKEYADHLRETGFFESKFRSKIPHPAHDNAARVIGKYVIPVLIQHEVILDQIFPGDFSVSTGTEVGDYENRNFPMKAWKNKKPLCDITISFPHSHREFDFPAKPFITIGTIYDTYQMNYKEKFSNMALIAKTGIIDDVFKVANNKDIIFLASGAPDASLLPFKTVEKLTKEMLRKYGSTALQYGTTAGFPPLRQAVMTLLKKRSIECSMDDIHISTGAQGGVNNICMVLLNKGDTILVESPTYSGALNTFRPYEVTIDDVATDTFGMVPEALEEKLKTTSVKFIYLVPTFQNPTGNSMNFNRRREIAEVAKRYETLIIEDDAYYDLRYKGDDLPSTYRFAPDNVIYVGSFSKIFSPAMRLGYVVAPKEIMVKILAIKQILDLNTSSYTQALTAEFLNNHYLEQHLEIIKKVYAGRLHAMLTALHTHMPKDFSWSQPEGGIFVWVTGPGKFDAGNLFLKAMEAGVAIIPGASFYARPNQGINTFRLNFASATEENITKGIKILSGIIRE